MALEIFKLVGSIFVDTDKANDSISKTDKKAEGLAGKLLKGVGTAAKWGAGIVTAAGAAATAVTAMAADYESSFAKVSTLLSGTGEEIEKYKNDILKASSETGVSVDEMSESVYNAISAGVDQADAIGFVTEALKLAKGGFTDTATSVDVLTTAMNAYSQYGLEAGEVSDMLITTQNLGKTTVDELASSMGKIIPTANAYGVQIDNLCGMYATMTSNGIATAESTTYMNSMLNELGKSGTNTDKILREMTKDVQEGGLGFSDMMSQGWELSDCLSLLEQYAGEAGLSVMDLFGSAEAGKAAQVLISNTEQMNTAIDSMRNSAGATEEAYEKMNDTVESKINRIKNNLVNIGISIGEKCLPIVDKLVSKVLDNMPKIEGAIERAGPVVEGVLNTFLPQMTSMASNILPAIMNIFMALLPVFTQIAETILPKLVELFTGLAPPLIQLVEAVLPILKTLLDALMPILSLLIDILTPIITLVVDIATVILDVIGTVLGPLIDIIGELIELTLTPLMETLQEVGQVFSDVFGAAKDRVSEDMAFMEQSIAEHGGGIKGIIGAVGDYTKKNWTDAFNRMDQITDGKLSEIKQKVDKHGGGIKGLVSVATERIKQNWENAFSAMDSITGGKLGNIVSGVRSKMSEAKENVLNILGKIKDGISDRLEMASGIVHTAIEKIKGFFNFEWSLPHLKMPHPTISGSFSLNPPSVPSFGIDWYAKAMEQPMIMEQPTAFGINARGQIMAGGEAGSEVVSGTDTLMHLIAETVEQQNKRLMDVMQEVLQVLNRMLEKEGRDIVLYNYMGSELLEEKILQAQDTLTIRTGGRV